MNIILGDGINDLCDEVAIKIIFKQDLKPMYENISLIKDLPRLKKKGIFVKNTDF
jgi:hypothetical protein